MHLADACSSKKKYINRFSYLIDIKQQLAYEQKKQQSSFFDLDVCFFDPCKDQNVDQLFENEKAQSVQQMRKPITFQLQSPKYNIFKQFISDKSSFKLSLDEDKQYKNFQPLHNLQRFKQKQFMSKISLIQNNKTEVYQADQKMKISDINFLNSIQQTKFTIRNSPSNQSNALYEGDLSRNYDKISYQSQQSFSNDINKQHKSKSKKQHGLTIITQAKFGIDFNKLKQSGTKLTTLETNHNTPKVVRQANKIKYSIAKSSSKIKQMSGKLNKCNEFMRQNENQFQQQRLQYTPTVKKSTSKSKLQLVGKL